MWTRKYLKWENPIEECQNEFCKYQMNEVSTNLSIQYYGIFIMGDNIQLLVQKFTTKINTTSNHKFLFQMVFQKPGFMKYYALEKWTILEEAFKGLKRVTSSFTGTLAFKLHNRLVPSEGRQEVTIATTSW